MKQLERMELEIDGRQIVWQVTYRQRKSLKITVEPPNCVSVVAPKGLSKQRIIDCMRQKAHWIIKQMDRMEALGIEARGKTYKEGELFLFQGQSYPLAIQQEEHRHKARVSLEADRFVVKTPILEVYRMEQAMEQWYRKQTYEAVMRAYRRYEAHIVRKPIAIVVKQQKKRWGSCSSKGKLMFNWRLSMAPQEVVDYVVVHEMCHLVHMNHSEAFWSLVASIMPDYKERERWLKDYGHQMQIEAV